MSLAKPLQLYDRSHHRAMIRDLITVSVIGLHKPYFALSGSNIAASLNARVIKRKLTSEMTNIELNTQYICR